MIKNFNSSFKTNFRINITFKAALIFLLTIFLLIPLFLVQSQIEDRSRRYKDTVREIAHSWANGQNLRGPVLAVPYEKKVSGKKNRVYTVPGTTYFLPDSLEFDIKLDPQERYRGIYKTVVYTSHISAKGKFSLQRDKFPNLFWKQAFLVIGVSDLRGLVQTPNVTWNDSAISCLPGTKSNLFASGLHGMLPLSDLSNNKVSIPFSMTLELRGSDQFDLLPLGADTRAKIESSWCHPSFNGNFLPVSRTISNQGFESTWQIPHLARGYPKSFDNFQLENIKSAIQESKFGIRMIQPINHYMLTMRAVKYGVLFILFTFITFFLFELNTRNSLHILQYALVGVSLVTFFLILIALSEHLSFVLAYVSASVAVITQIVLYTYQTLRSFKSSIALGGILISLYSYLYMTLQIEDYALLVGAISLFFILSAIMFFTRNIQWYHSDISQKNNTDKLEG
ncbi:MAG: cell envelope integrity protein CreD [Pseudomonadota bacterium]